MIHFELGKLSTYRTELMGISAILILVCHASGRGVILPFHLSTLLSFGNIGVDMFLLLSGIGLFYSLEKLYITKRGGVMHWYSVRYKRILVPYLLMAIPYYAYVCIVENLGVCDFLSFITTVSFWLEHRGVWFIAAIIPLYLISPLLYKMEKHYGSKVLILLFLAIYIIGILPINSDNTSEHSLLENLLFVTWRVPSFILGFIVAPFVKKNTSISVWCLVLLFVIGGTILFVSRHLVFSYVWFIIPLSSLVIYFLRYQYTSKVCSFMGRISLESYLCNACIPYTIVAIPCSYINNNWNLLTYISFVMLGILISLLLNKISKRILCRNY